MAHATTIGHGGFSIQERKPRAVSTTSKKREMSFWQLHSRRIGVMLLNYLFGNDLMYWAIGWAMTFFGSPIKGVFTLYPTRPKYAAAYVYDWYRRQMQWKPRLVGIIRQNGRTSLIFGISATDQDIWDGQRTGGLNLKKVIDRMEVIRRLLRAERKTFAGIIPGVANRLGLLDNPDERGITVRGVRRSIQLGAEAEGLSPNVPVVVIGAEGYIGAELCHQLAAEKQPYFAIDLKNKEAFPIDWRGQAVIVLNLSKGGALKEYLPKLWKGVTILNEVYPEPDKLEVEFATKIGVPIYHIKGLHGEAFPQFPSAYFDSIPLCASFDPQNGDLDVRLLKL